MPEKENKNRKKKKEIGEKGVSILESSSQTMTLPVKVSGGEIHHPHQLLLSFAVAGITNLKYLIASRPNVHCSPHSA